ncbi:MAG TPA: calcium-binding EGF-like domain-containing protein [Saprospiraceae bacterium]|nr:calcium-binding EGF-like domain-containing protein [Saprospiraceae bacterium]
MKPMQFLFVLLPLSVLSLFSCSERSVCDDVMCENGGICLDGTCDCPVGFTGVHCQERATPDYIRITTLTVTRFPELKDNSTWDASDGPDLFFRLFNEKIVIGQPDYLVENAIVDRTYQFDFHFIDITDPAHTYTLQLLDFDGVDIKEDFLGEITFIPFENEKGFPETITLDNGGPIAFTMTVDYYYNNHHDWSDK